MAKAVISTTYSNTYLYFLPIVTFCWTRLGVDVICFMPSGKSTVEKSGGVLQGVYPDGNKKMYLINETIKKNNGNLSIHCFSAPEHKEATYAQCSRLYGACLDLPEDEVLCIGDVDMLPFQALKNCIDNSIVEFGDMINVLGVDLVPEGQTPMCYAWGSVKQWRKAYQYAYGEGYYDKDYFKTYQEHLDLLLGEIECENMRGNYWSKDQQELNSMLKKAVKAEHLRAREGTQFAKARVDRTDTNWRAYVNDELIDAHLWRDGFTEQNHANIMELMRMKFPDEDFTWLENYRTEYLKLI